MAQAQVLKVELDRNAISAIKALTKAIEHANALELDRQRYNREMDAKVMGQEHCTCNRTGIQKCPEHGLIRAVPPIENKGDNN